jgi:CheY-like chemotaxis protein
MLDSAPVRTRPVLGQRGGGFLFYPLVADEQHTSSGTQEARLDILLVEDNADIRAVLIEFLTDEGYVVCGATHGADALAVLRGTPALPRLIVLDLMMPVLNGWEFRARQRANPAWAGIPVVVLTASPALLDAYGPMDVATLLAKPLDLDRLLAVVVQYCPRVDAQPSTAAPVDSGHATNGQTATVQIPQAHQRLVHVMRNV